MADWKRVLRELTAELETRVDEARARVRARRTDRRPARVVPYRGYGADGRVLVLARVLEDPPPEPADAASPWWKNLAATLRRLESDEVPHARVRVLLPDGAARDVTADEEGHVRAWLPAGPLDPATPWHTVRLELPDEPAAAPPAEARVLVPTPTARVGVVSDLDDTVVQTDATDLVRMLKQILLGNAHTRLPFPGVAAFYRALHRGARGDEGNPLFYVSSSPWNLYDVLEQVLDIHGIPAGPLLLRDWGIRREELLPLGHRAHKLAAIERILETYPTLPFVLIGDSGQEDPEIYHEVIHRHPGRIAAAYIRNVTPVGPRGDAIRALAEEVVAAGSALVLADDTLAAARHAAEHGWIAPAALVGIEKEARREEAERGGAGAPT
ncbi:MAG: DUF2183 domain-containing protein, partial [Gemmatimonadetes bacterium]|nr:DUF2183 domain-containing protein [Gemmatimonadota bacterium]